MNPLDAEKEGLKDFDTIECYNERGKVRAPVRLDHAIPPGPCKSGLAGVRVISRKDVF